MATIKQVANKIGKDLNESYPNIQNLFDVLKRGFKDMENVSGGGGGGSEVTYTQTAQSGGECGTITIDGTPAKIYAPIPYKFTSAVSAAIGATSATITDAAITTNSVIDIFSETSSGKLINVKQCVVTTGQAILSFDALEEAASFKLQIFN